ncbi:RecB family exonuclease [Chloroflexota bacterium]
MRPLSYTQISMYQTCPLQYKLQYIDHLRPKEKWYFSFGSTLHLCAQRFFKVEVPPPPSLEELLQFYEDKWISAGYQSSEDEERYKKYGRDILTDFWKIHSAGFELPVAIEKSFYVDINGIKVRGFIDRVDKLESGGLSIVDYKSNQGLFTRENLEDNLQLTLYQMAAEQTWHLPVEKLTLYHLRSNTPCGCDARDKKVIDDARCLVLEVAESIMKGEFPATEHQYCPCDFASHCPYYQQQLEPAKELNIPQKITVNEAVERYASLQEQIKELEAQLGKMKQLIIDFCQEEGLNRVYGDRHALTYKLMDRTGFNEDEVRTLLEPEGLWQKVLSLDQSRLKQLITDEATAGVIKLKLETLRQVISTSPRLWVKKINEEEQDA